uniref:hypothetical protein n=1 Tax=uncultured Erythrobacter sp. TaxID=263913 RepID=UPI002619865E|nr:hypothetical protein [uncultured Erythrobacter sp.]
MPGPASAETYEEYLSRLRDICAVDCMQPREFQRTARKASDEDAADMALIMDVAEVRLVGKKFELLSLDLRGSPLEDIAILGSAGVNTSSSTGVGGLPRGNQGGTYPELIIVEMDEATLFDLLNVPVPPAETTSSAYDADGVDANEDESAIIVEGDAEREVVKPSLKSLRTVFRNRRIVVRGSTRLKPVLIGARRDFRRKQVTLVLDDADKLALLPRYDKDGNPVVGM